MKRILSVVFVLGILCGFVTLALAQEDKIVQVAIETFKAQIRMPSGGEIKFLKKKEAPIPGFFTR